MKQVNSEFYLMSMKSLMNCLCLPLPYWKKERFLLLIRHRKRGQSSNATGFFSNKLFIKWSCVVFAINSYHIIYLCECLQIVLHLFIINLFYRNIFASNTASTALLLFAYVNNLYSFILIFWFHKVGYFLNIILLSSCVRIAVKGSGRPARWLASYFIFFVVAAAFASFSVYAAQLKDGLNLAGLFSVLNTCWGVYGGNIGDKFCTNIGIYLERRWKITPET